MFVTLLKSENKYPSVLLGVLMACFTFTSFTAFSQTKKVLFIGNSYTYYNNLPQMVTDVAATVGDSIITDEVTSGGARLLTHAANPQVYAKMKANDWTYVVFQAQSQEPSWPMGQVQTDVFPYAAQLSDSVHALNSCAMPMFFMTWGRKNGDQQNCPNWPPVCTYEGMDSLLSERYQIMADDNDGVVSPVGKVWNYIRANYPNIDLYTNDGSHPSAEGSYAAAVTFYTMITQKDPTLTSDVGGIDATKADQIRQAAKTIVYNDLGQWNVLDYNATSDFSFTQNGDTCWFTNSSTTYDNLLWDFGDGQTSTQVSPMHVYTTPGNYTVQLTASGCYNVDVTGKNIDIVNSVNRLNEEGLTIWPNPAVDFVRISGTENLSSAVFKMFNVAGQQVLTGQVVNNQINLSQVPQGLYLLQVNTANNKQYIVRVNKR